VNGTRNPYALMALAIQFLSACIRKGIEEKIRELRHGACPWGCRTILIEVEGAGAERVIDAAF
jgi:hypothetical protein